MWHVLKLFWNNYFKFKEGRTWGHMRLDWRMARLGWKRKLPHNARGRLFEATERAKKFSSDTVKLTPTGSKIHAPIGVRLSVRPRRVYRRDLGAWVDPNDPTTLHEDQSASGSLPRGRVRN